MTEASFSRINAPAHMRLSHTVCASPARPDPSDRLADSHADDLADRQADRLADTAQPRRHVHGEEDLALDGPDRSNTEHATRLCFCFWTAATRLCICCGTVTGLAHHVVGDPGDSTAIIRDQTPTLPQRHHSLACAPTYHVYICPTSASLACWPIGSTDESFWACCDSLPAHVPVCSQSPTTPVRPRPTMGW